MKQEGIDFVMDLKKRYGLLEAIRIANNYIAIPMIGDNPDEIQFRKGVEEAIRKLDTI